MAGFIQVTAMGNLTRDPQVKFLPSGTSVCEFGIATNRKYTTKAGEQREEVCFVDCAAFGKTGEFVSKYFQKGKQIVVMGSLKLDTWEDKNGGGKRSKHSISVDTVHFAGGKDGGGQPRQNAGNEAGDPGEQSYEPDPGPEIAKDDIPF